MKPAFHFLQRPSVLWVGCVLSLLGLEGRAQASGLEWIRTAGGLRDDGLQSVAAGSNGVVFATGVYVQSAEVGGVMLTNDACCIPASFLVSYGWDGSPRWVRDLGPLFDQRAPSVISLAAGGIRLAGFVSGTGEIDGTVVTGPGLWVAAYSAEGVPAWSRTISTSWLGSPRLAAIAGDAEGNLYLCGGFSGTLQLGELSVVSANQSQDVFTAALDATGGTRWLRKAGGSGSDEAAGIGVDAAGRVYVTGWFQHQANFGGVVVETPSGQGLFVAQYEPAGPLGWVRAAQSTGQSAGHSLVASPEGGCYVGGFGYDSVQLGEETLPVTPGRQALILAAFDAAGTVSWLRSVEVEGGAAPVRVARDGDGYIYLGGSFGARLWVGGQDWHSWGEMDLFVVRFDAAGRAGWTELGGFIYQDVLAGMVADGDQGLILAGQFSDSFLWGDRYLEGAGGQDGFLVRLSTVPVQPVIREIYMVPALLVEGARGGRVTVEYASRPEATNWTVLTNLLLVESPSWFIDLSATNSQQRYYRLVSEE